jgi:hypothetical protein
MRKLGNESGSHAAKPADEDRAAESRGSGRPSIPGGTGPPVSLAALLLRCRDTVLIKPTTSTSSTKGILLWRKPYVDGAVRELTSGDSRSADQLRRAVEELTLSARDNRAYVRTAVHAGHATHSNVRVDVSIDQPDDLIDDIRRNSRELYIGAVCSRNQLSSIQRC